MENTRRASMLTEYEIREAQQRVLYETYPYIKILAHIQS